MCRTNAKVTANKADEMVPMAVSHFAISSDSELCKGNVLLQRKLVTLPFSKCYFFPLHELLANSRCELGKGTPRLIPVPYPPGYRNH